MQAIKHFHYSLQSVVLYRNRHKAVIWGISYVPGYRYDIRVQRDGYTQIFENIPACDLQSWEDPVIVLQIAESNVPYLVKDSA